MAKIDDLINVMQDLAPLSKAYPVYDDNIGFLVGDRAADLTTVLCCLDCTSKVIEQAKSLKAQLIISHHPVIFSSVKNVITDTVLGSNLISLIKNNIAVYSAHTNLDYCAEGINEYVAQLLNLKNVKPLDPYISKTEGFGRAGDLDKEISAIELFERAKKAFGDKGARLIGANKAVKSAAIINGGGGSDISYIDMAINNGADCLITGDIKHHVAVYAAEKGFPLIEVSHFALESIYIPRLTQILKQKCAQNNIDVKILTADEHCPYI